MAVDTAAAILIIGSIGYLFLLADKIRSDNKAWDIAKQFILLVGLFMSVGALNLAIQFISGTTATQGATLSAIYGVYLILGVVMFIGFLMFLLYEGGKKFIEKITKMKFQKQRK